MLSKQKQKYMLSLHNKKFRKEYGCFLVEGKKGIDEMLGSHFSYESIYIAPEFYPEYSHFPKVFEAEKKDIAKVSSFKSNSFGIAVAITPHVQLDNNLEKGWHIYLEGVKDPGNFGTILRLADWYGYESIYCSLDCVDAYNPKSVSASMGSIFRVKVFPLHLSDLVVKKQQPLFIADLEGDSVHGLDYPEGGILVFGSESHGPVDSLQFNHRKIAIPRYGKAESLNVAVSVGIILDGLARQLKN